MSPLDPEIPPVGEEIHLPGPTIQPLLLAVGISMAIVGITIALIGVLEGPVLWIPGTLLTVGVLIAWIRDTVREIDELPLDHHH